MEEDEAFIWTEEETQKFQRENPLNLSFWADAFINGKRSEQTGGSDGYWLPLEGAERDSEVGLALLHYDLPLDRCWKFSRCAFPWATKKKPALKSLFFWLNQEPFDLYGEPFTAEAGERVELIHPATGEKHVLTVLDSQPDCEASAIAFIGGMDGPTALCVGVEEGSQSQIAMSSLHFEPAERVQWRPVFRVRELESVKVEAI